MQRYKTGLNQVGGIAESSNDRIENAFHVRCTNYLANVKSKLLTRTILEVDSDKKVLTHSNKKLTKQVYKQKRTESLLLKSEARLRDFAQTASDWFWETDENFHISYVSERCSEILGVDIKQIIGKHISEACSAKSNDLGNKLVSHMYTLEHHIPFRDFEFSIENSDGDISHFLRSGKPFFDNKGKFLGYRGSTRDITERKRAEEQVKYLANHDSLTHLPVLRLVRDRIEVAMERASRQKTGIAVLFLDLNKFKPVNDKYGHRIGDLVLVEVAKRLKRSIRASDTVGRIGGDEFIVVLSDIDSGDDLAEVAGKIQSLINKPIVVEGKKLNIGISIGAAIYPYHSARLDDLIHCADIAMYTAKRDKRQNYVLYDETQE